jgi:uncharacterized DUF497 family protein
VNIIWDEKKSERLKVERGISLDDVAVMILEKKYIDIVKHPKRPGQWMFVLPIKNYIHVVPYVVDGDENIVLKTVFPSRKFHKRFGGRKT